MATTPNQKPVPSEDYVNMRFNAGKLDEFMTSTASSYVDRLGVTHLTVTGIQQSVTGALLPANNLSDVQSAATSRTNLGATTIGSQLFTATSAANARAAILAAKSGANSDITGLTGIVTAPLLTDANAITYSGWSYITSGSSSNPPAGFSGAASMFTNQITSTVSSQIAHAVTANVLYTRGQTATGTYTPWIPLAKAGANSDITSLTGVTNASDASAGVVGEYLTNTTSGTAIVTGTAVNATSLVLTAGDWDVDGAVSFIPNGASFTVLNGGINTVSATNPVFPNRFQYALAFTSATQYIPTTMRRVSVSATTTVYLIAQATFTGGTGSTVGGFIRARRVR